MAEGIRKVYTAPCDLAEWGTLDGRSRTQGNYRGKGGTNAKGREFMNSSETDRFVSNVLGGLWPDWTPTDEEMRVWYGVMSHYDYDTAQTAAQQYFADAGGNFKRPKPSGITTKAKVIIQNRNVGKSSAKDPVLTNVYIECIEPPNEIQNWKVRGKPSMPPQTPCNPTKTTS